MLQKFTNNWNSCSFFSWNFKYCWFSTHICTIQCPNQYTIVI